MALSGHPPSPPPPTTPPPPVEAAPGRSRGTRPSRPATTTRTPYQSTVDGSRGSECTSATPSASTWTPCPSSTPSVEASLAELFRLLEKGSELRGMGARVFLRPLGLRGREDLGFCSLKTFPDSSRTTGGGRSRGCSEGWMPFGMMRSGSALTARIGSPSAERGSSLSDALESLDSIPPQYFLSGKALRSLLAHSARHAAKGHGFSHRIVECASVEAHEEEAAAAGVAEEEAHEEEAEEAAATADECQCAKTPEQSTQTTQRGEGPGP